MAHTTRDKKKLTARVRRIRGQVEAIERALEAEEECFSVLLTVAACRGALNSLMAVIIEGHIREHVLDPNVDRRSERAMAAEQLVDVVRAFLK
jgi:DNA-binding FrmR family transcriptional regulator